jgi:hypothetical protein
VLVTVVELVLVLSFEVFWVEVVWLVGVDVDSCASCESWAIKPLTPPTPTTTIPTVARRSRRAPRARTLPGRWVEFMSSVLSRRTEGGMTALCASAVSVGLKSVGRVGLEPTAKGL